MDRTSPDEIWVHPSIRVGRSAIEGLGLVTTTGLERGAVLLRLAGVLVSTEELATLLHAASVDSSKSYVDSLTVAEDRHLVLPPRSVAHFGNHSCDPNMWLVGTYAIGARRRIRSGEELTVDYATQSGAGGLSMVCRCGSTQCRGAVTSDDWRLLELQDRYRGHWVDPLERRIAALGTAT
jgi:uncharacterized protein